jgi:hypothetical protein
VWRQFSFSSIATSKIRVVVNAGADNAYSRVVEVEAWTGPSWATNINWLVTDQLGTPRMVFDQSGSLATVKRRDYAPFGEELFNGARSIPLGYAANDTTRQKFTQENGIMKRVSITSWPDATHRFKDASRVLTRSSFLTNKPTIHSYGISTTTLATIHSMPPTQPE